MWYNVSPIYYIVNKEKRLVWENQNLVFAFTIEVTIGFALLALLWDCIALRRAQNKRKTKQDIFANEAELITGGSSDIISKSLEKVIFE